MIGKRWMFVPLPSELFLFCIPLIFFVLTKTVLFVMSILLANTAVTEWRAYHAARTGDPFLKRKIAFRARVCCFFEGFFFTPSPRQSQFAFQAWWYQFLLSSLSDLFQLKSQVCWVSHNSLAKLLSPYASKHFVYFLIVQLSLALYLWCLSCSFYLHHSLLNSNTCTPSLSMKAMRYVFAILTTHTDHSGWTYSPWSCTWRGSWFLIFSRT
mgnify:CR=1 FL=1